MKLVKELIMDVHSSLKCEKEFLAHCYSHLFLENSKGKEKKE